MAVKAVPDGYHTVQPYVIVQGAAKLIDFTKAAFGAQEKERMPGPDGKIMHAEIRIGDSVVMLSDANADFAS
ncbi:MAG: VOC family protein, partial [Dehalococcoidia bacterium]|nr:VOC family protein [Dehalococcoidia bacterium]